jgi:CBS domain-containing membrane protein
LHKELTGIAWADQPGGAPMFKISELMTSPVYSLRETDTLQSARVLMDQKRIRHVPITSGSNIFRGLITNRDVLANTISHLADIDQATQNEIDAGIPLQEIMRTDVHTISPEDSVKDAANILYNHKYGCLPVVDNGKLVGIVTEADFLQLTIQLLEAMDQAAAAAKS